MFSKAHPAEPGEERLAMEAVMESVDPATWPGLTTAQRCALGRFAKPQTTNHKPQIAEHQPELYKYQPCGCVVCTCEHDTQCQGCGAEHCGTHPVGQFPEPVYQQVDRQALAKIHASRAADDLHARNRLLVEALEWLRGAINCTPENDKHQVGAWISTNHPRIKQIDGLLTTHRKGGGQ